MTVSDLPKPLSPDDPRPGASWHNALLRAARQVLGLTVAAPLEMSEAGRTKTIRVGGSKPLMGQLSGSTSPYSWVEVVGDGSGGWSAVSGGRSGTTNAAERNAVAGLGGRVYELTPSNADDWRFSDIRDGACEKKACLILYDLGTGDPLPGISVVIRRYVPSVENVTVKTDVTDGDGSICYSPYVIGKYYLADITFTMGSATCTRTVTLLSPTEGPCDVVKEVDLCGGRLLLTVTETGGGAMSGLVLATNVNAGMPTCGGTAVFTGAYGWQQAYNGEVGGGVYSWDYCGVFPHGSLALPCTIRTTAGQVLDGSGYITHLENCDDVDFDCGDAANALELFKLDPTYLDTGCGFLLGTARTISCDGVDGLDPANRNIVKKSLYADFGSVTGCGDFPVSPVAIPFTGYSGGYPVWDSGTFADPNVYYCLATPFAVPGLYDTPLPMTGRVILTGCQANGTPPKNARLVYERRPSNPGACAPGTYYYGPATGDFYFDGDMNDHPTAFALFKPAALPGCTGAALVTE